VINHPDPRTPHDQHPEPTQPAATAQPPPARRHDWLCVFPTLTAINLTFGNWLAPMSPVVRTFVLATIAVPIVIYGLLPHLHHARIHPLSRQR
jgi:antibiotic biosynthesis monooxygenase (ABM) superfamily enzyme